MTASHTQPPGGDVVRDVARVVTRSKVMAIRFVAHFSALNAERADPRDAARRAAAVDPDVVGPDADLRLFLTSRAELTREAVGSAPTLASRADDVVRALLVHTYPAYQADFQHLYAPFATDIGFDRLLLG